MIASNLCGLIRRTKLLSILIVASLIGPVRLKDYRSQPLEPIKNTHKIVKSEINNSVIGGQSTVLSGPPLTSSIEINYESIHHAPKRTPFSISSQNISRESNFSSLSSSSPVLSENLTLNGRPLSSAGPLMNPSDHEVSDKSRIKTEIILNLAEEEAEEDCDKEIRGISLPNDSKSNQVTFETSGVQERKHRHQIFVEDESKAHMNQEKAQTNREYTMAAERINQNPAEPTSRHYPQCQNRSHEKSYISSEKFSTLITSFAGNGPPDGIPTTTNTSTSKVSGAGRPKARDTRSRLRLPRSALVGSQAGEAAQLQAPMGMTTMNTIQSVVGQPLTIPCTNQTQSTAADSNVSGHQAQQQPKKGHRLLSGQRSRGGGGGGGGGGKQVANGQGISLIVWHKDNQLESPIFTVDARGASSLRDAKQQTDLESLRGRAHLEESTRVDGRGLGLAPALVIDEASSEDVGVYTCTVDFYKAPTQTHQMRVLLINPPRNMIIRDQQSGQKEASQPQQQQHKQSLAQFGPYDEESHLALTCEFEPGEPIAQVSWWQLKSVTIPATARVAGSNRHSLEMRAAAGDSSESPEAELMTTITLQEDFDDENHGSLRYHGGELEKEEPARRRANGAKSVRDYFVAFHSGATSVREQHGAGLVLPFADGYRLRHWARVKDQVSWSSVATQDGARIQSTLGITSLNRANLGDEYLCLARNNEFSSPLNSSVKIDLNLKPTEIKIVNKSNYVFKMGQKITIECHVYGSRPAAKVRWFRGPQELDTSGSSISKTNDLQQSFISELNRDIKNNLTKISYLTLIPQLSDNQQSLSCSANNPRMPNVPPISDSMVMNVLYPAQMLLQFGAGIKQEQIRLGSHVFMDCNIQSNPPIDDLTWFFNGQPVVQNASAGIIIGEMSLVIQGIRIEHRGHYQCMAQNSLGKFKSNKLELKPKFEPVCDYSLTKTKYKVAVNQSVKIECNVLAEPSDDIHFVWQFNQTFGDSEDADSIIVQPLKELKQYETNFTKSYINFTPESRRNYGQLLCSASNSINKQEKPCIIQVVASEIPEPVYSCFFDNFTNSSFNVYCQPSSTSSSMRHNYLLELYTNESTNRESSPIDSPHAIQTHLRQRNQENQNMMMDDEQVSSSHQQQQQQQVKRMTSEFPTFRVTDLKPDTSYNVMIYAQNSKGRSAPYLQAASTLPADPSLDPMASNEGGGQIQFSNRFPNEAGSLSGRLISYWRAGDYLNGDGSKLLLGIVLIVLLCTITIVTFAFFVVRLCRSPTQTRQDRSNHRKRNKQLRSGRGGGRGADFAGDVDKLRTYNGKGPQLDKSVQLNPVAAPSTLKALAGSGSDTSRETNTDSTLISLCLTKNHENSIDRNQDQALKASTNGRASFGSTADMNRIGAGQNQNYRLANGRLVGSPMVNSLSYNLNNGQEKLQSVYNTTKRSNNLNSPRDLEHNSNTPQTSIQSGSDCTTSNNELHADGSEFQDKLLIRCQDGQLGEPVYVIEREGLITGGNGASQCCARQVRILNHPGSFCSNYSDQMVFERDRHNGSVNGLGTQVSSSATADSFDQTTPTASNSGHLSRITPYQPLSETLDGSTGSHKLPLPISFLPNSVSIPVSLAGGECPHLAAGNYHHRRFSHEFLAEDLCLASPPIGPYLTLAPTTEQSLGRQKTYGCHPEQQSRAFPYSDGLIGVQQQQQQLVEALDNLDPSGHYHCENPSIVMDVMADNIGQHTQTLNDIYRRTGMDTIPPNQVTNARLGQAQGQKLSQRISFDDQEINRHADSHITE